MRGNVHVRLAGGSVETEPGQLGYRDYFRPGICRRTAGRPICLQIIARRYERGSMIFTKTHFSKLKRHVFAGRGVNSIGP